MTQGSPTRLLLTQRVCTSRAGRTDGDEHGPRPNRTLNPATAVQPVLFPPTREASPNVLGMKKASQNHAALVLQHARVARVSFQIPKKGEAAL